MKLTKEEKENIKTYFLIKEGIEITEVTEFHNYLLLKPYGVIPFNDKIYINKQIEQKIYLNRNKITDISPLSNLTNLKELSLTNNNVTDISPLSNLTNLKELYLTNNNIADLSPLSTLINLNHLNLWRNKITYISPLSNLTNLKYLSLSFNEITDISPLSSLSNLKELSFWGNNFLGEKIKELKNKLPNCLIFY